VEATATRKIDVTNYGTVTPYAANAFDDVEFVVVDFLTGSGTVTVTHSTGAHDVVLGPGDFCVIPNPTASANIVLTSSANTNQWRFIAVGLAAET
jgi:hypothetical protein